MTIKVILVAETHVEHTVITGEYVPGAVGVMTVRIHDSEAFYPSFLKRLYGQGSTVEIAHSPVKISAGMVVAKAGKDKSIINFPLPDFISRLDCPAGGV